MTAPPRVDSPTAAAELWRCWREGTTLPELPPGLRPRTLDEGWEIQRQLDPLAGPPCGWKIAATSPAGQAHIGADGPLVGRLYRSTMVRTGATVGLREATMESAEAEFAFRLGRDLRPGGVELVREEVLAAVVAVLPAIELPGSRFTDFSRVGLPSLVADAMCVGKVVVAEPSRRPHPDSLATHQVSMIRDGVEAATGSGADVLGDPCEALVWLARELARRGGWLRRGEVVITGACTTPIRIGAGDELRADFGALGGVSVDIGAALPGRLVSASPKLAPGSSRVDDATTAPRHEP